MRWRILGHKISRESVANFEASRCGAGPGTGQENALEGFHPVAFGSVSGGGFLHGGVWTASGLMTYYVLAFMRV